MASWPVRGCWTASGGDAPADPGVGPGRVRQDHPARLVARRPTTAGVAWLSLDASDADPASFWTVRGHRAAGAVARRRRRVAGAASRPHPRRPSSVLTALVNELADGAGRGVAGARRLPRRRRPGGRTGHDLPSRPPAAAAARRARHPLRSRPARWRAAGPRRAHRGPRRRPPLHARPRRPRSSTAPGLRPHAPTRSRPSRSAPRAGSPACSWPRSPCGGATTSRDFIDGFTGSNRFVIDYLVDEVLARQPAPVRDFLLRTAVLDRLTGPLCDAVTGPRRRQPRCSQDLERDNLFVVPLDDRRRLVPLPPPVRRRPPRSPARRASRPGAGAAPAGQRLVRRARPRRRRRPARPGRRRRRPRRLPDGVGAAGDAPRPAGQPAAGLDRGRCPTPRAAQPGAQHRLGWSLADDR